MRDIKHGSTDQSTVVRIVDSTDGTPETGVVAATAGLALWYRREGGLKVALTAANNLADPAAVHTDGGLIHIGDGYYRVDPQDAAWASGSTGVTIGGTVTGMVVIGAYHPLVAIDNQDATKLGLSSLTTLESLAATINTNTDQVEGYVDTVEASLASILAKLPDIYIASVDLVRDDQADRDEYTITLTRNGVEITSGITVPKITALKRDATTLINNQGLVSVNGGVFYYNASAAERQADDDAIVLRITATIDGTPRTFFARNVS